jgi:hypothetical protein
MESDREKEERLNREFWESLTPESIDKLLEELARKTNAFLNFDEPSMPRKTRRKKPRR